MSMLWTIASTLQSTHNKLGMLLVAWALCTLLCTTSALNITKPVPGDTIDISYPYNVTWTWTEQDNLKYPEVRMQVSPYYEESTNIITAAGVATFWAAGAVVNAQGMVSRSAQISLVDPGNLGTVLAFVVGISITNSLNISAVPSGYSTTLYPATPLATSTPPTAPSPTFATTTATSARSSTTASTSRSASLSGGVIAGIVIGAVATVALIATCITMCLLFGKRRVKYTGVATENHTRAQPSKPDMDHEAVAMHSRGNIEHSWAKPELPATAVNRGYR